MAYKVIEGIVNVARPPVPLPALERKGAWHDNRTGCGTHVLTGQLLPDWVDEATIAELLARGLIEQV